MKDLKSKILFVAFFALSIINYFTKNSIYDDYISYAQIAILIVLIVFLITRLINNFRNDSISPEEKKTMIINMLLIVILLILGYFIISSSTQIKLQ